MDDVLTSPLVLLDKVTTSWITYGTLPIMLLFTSHIMAFNTPYAGQFAEKQLADQESEAPAPAAVDNYYYYTMCDYNGHKFPPGYFSPEACINCNCNATTGRVLCSARDCPPIAANCIKFDTAPGDGCCPRCVKRGCYHHGKRYSAGAKINENACEKCYCPWEGGDEETGAPRCINMECPDLRCVDPVVPEDKCCPVCPNGPNCWLDGEIIPEGKRLFIDKCRYCYCSNLEYIHNSTQRHATCIRSIFCV